MFMFLRHHASWFWRMMLFGGVGLWAWGSILPAFAETQPYQVGDIEIINPWARASPTPIAKAGAVYLTIQNGGRQQDSLVGVASPIAAHSTLHDHQLDDQGVMRMRPLGMLALAPGQKVTLRPAGRHVMLMGLKAPLQAGETLPLRLIFQRAGTITLSVPIRNFTHK